MCKTLLEVFDDIYIVNLHGNSKRKETAPDGGKDESVFDIMVGTNIALFVKHNDKRKKGELAAVHYLDFTACEKTNTTHSMRSPLKTPIGKRSNARPRTISSCQRISVCRKNMKKV